MATLASQEFQSTPPRGATSPIEPLISRWCSFNPRPREGATHEVARSWPSLEVSIHAPARGDCGSRAATESGTFQSTPPRRGDVDADRLHESSESSFNPRPREGATQRSHVHDDPVFQSTPPRRGDRVDVTTIVAQRFQSTPPRRGDVDSRTILAQRSQVSIHAPAKGRPRRRWLRARSPRQFQSTPPRRGDRDCAQQRCRSSFNPRPREGATPWPLRHGDLVKVSIHAPAKGRPRVEHVQPIADRCFNPRPREGATARPERRSEHRLDVSIHAPAKGRPRSRDRQGDAFEFQSTPPRRGDVSCSSDSRSSMVRFQSTPPRGATQPIERRSRQASGFNPRPREGATQSNCSPACDSG